jgi:hypothetical protein
MNPQPDKPAGDRAMEPTIPSALPTQAGGPEGASAMAPAMPAAIARVPVGRAAESLRLREPELEEESVRSQPFAEWWATTGRGDLMCLFVPQGRRDTETRKWLVLTAARIARTVSDLIPERSGQLRQVIEWLERWSCGSLGDDPRVLLRRLTLDLRGLAGGPVFAVWALMVSARTAESPDPALPLCDVARSAARARFKRAHPDSPVPPDADLPHLRESGDIVRQMYPSAARVLAERLTERRPR